MMSPMEFKIEQDEKSNVFMASWADPDGGGITTQAETLPELYSAIQEAVRCHFAAPLLPVKSLSTSRTIQFCILCETSA